MAARAAAACMCSKNSTKQYGSFPAVWVAEREGKEKRERKAVSQKPSLHICSSNPARRYNYRNRHSGKSPCLLSRLEIFSV